jgi:hypothetical protein
MLLVPIAIAHSPFKEKFGIPRQSGIASFVETRLAFLPPYRNADALRGLEGFSHLWLIWGFHANKQTNANKQPNQQKESKNPISQSSERHQPTFRSFERSEIRILADNIASSLRSFMSGQSIYKATHSHKKVRCYILAQLCAEQL